MFRQIAVSVLILLFSNTLICSFRIPVPFGSVDVNDKPGGNQEVSVNHGVNIQGNGAESGFTVGGGNGSGAFQSHGGIIANGETFGTNSTFGTNKDKDILLDTDVNVGDETLHGGIGKESQFLNETAALIKQKKLRKERTPQLKQVQ